MSLLQDHYKNIWPPFTSLKSDIPVLPVEKANGIYLHTTDGRKIIDAVSSWWVNIHGHSNPEIAKAMYDQAMSMEHVIFAGFTHQPAVDLSNNLLSILPQNQSKLFFSDNGSTAVEVGVKLAIQYWHNQGIAKKKIVTIEGAYHGDTFGNMSLAGGGDFYKPFLDYLFEVEQIDFPHPGKEDEVVAQYEKIVASGDVAAFLFEPLLQGSAGMRVYSSSVLERLLSISKKHDVITVADEVMTGFGRTGKIFATDHCQTEPDIFCLSKGLTGGTIALGVTTASSKIVEPFETSDKTRTFYHGHSFTANPVACAVANKSFEILMRDDTQRKIQDLSQWQKEEKERLEKCENLTNIESIGTVLRMEIKTDGATNYFNNIRDQLYMKFMNRDILLRPLGNVIYILPPYIITREELKLVVDAIIEELS